MSTISVSSAVSTGGNSHSSGGGGGGDSAAGSMTSSQISISTEHGVLYNSANPRVRFADSLDNDNEGYEDNFDNRRYTSKTYHQQQQNSTSQRSASSPGNYSSTEATQNKPPTSSPSTTDYQPQETVRYSPMYLCPQEGFLSRSLNSSPTGSNVSIIGSLVSPRKSASGKSTTVATTTGWKLRTRYSKRRGQERSIDRERQPSVCSDSETDSLSGGMVGKGRSFLFLIFLFCFV